MEHQIILNLLNEASDSKFVTRKWSIVNDQSNANYYVGNETVFNFCDINIIRHQVTQVAFKNCALFTKCITKVDGTTIGDAKDLYLVMPIYNRTDYSSNYSETTGNLWFYSKDEATNFNADIANNNNFRSF